MRVAVLEFRTFTHSHISHVSQPPPYSSVSPPSPSLTPLKNSVFFFSARSVAKVLCFRHRDDETLRRRIRRSEDAEIGQSHRLCAHLDHNHLPLQPLLWFLLLPISRLLPGSSTNQRNHRLRRATISSAASSSQDLPSSSPTVGGPDGNHRRERRHVWHLRDRRVRSRRSRWDQDRKLLLLVGSNRRLESSVSDWEA